MRISILISLCFCSFWLKAQEYEVERIIPIPHVVDANYVEHNGNFWVVCGFKNDTTIAGTFLEFERRLPFPGWKNNAQYNKALIHYNKNGKPLYARRLNTSDDYQIQYHLHKSGELSIAATSNRSVRYERFDSLGFKLVSRFICRDASCDKISFDLKDDGRFVLGIMAENKDAYLTVNTIGGYQQFGFPSKGKGYYHHYALICNKRGEVEQVLFTLGEKDPTVKFNNQNRQMVAMIGDTVWTLVGNYKGDEILLPDTTELSDNRTNYQGVLTCFINGELVDYTLHRVTYPFDEKLTNFPRLQLDNKIIYNNGQYSLITSANIGLSSFSLKHRQVSANWDTWLDSLNGNSFLSIFRRDASPFVSNSGIIYRLANTSHDEKTRPDLFEKYPENSIVLMTYNPFTGQTAGANLLGSGFRCKSFHDIIGENENGDVYVQVNTQICFDTTAYFMIGDEKIMAKNDRAYIVILKRNKSIIDSLVFSKITCQKYKYRVQTKHCQMVDSIVVKWGDNRITRCSNCFYLEHRYKSTGEYPLEAIAYNGTINTTLMGNKVIPNMERILPIDTFWVKGDTIYSLPKADGISYTWNNGDIGNTLTVDSFGKYVVTASYDTCSGSDTLVVAKQNVGFQEQYLSNNIQVFPNPASSTITIQIDNINGHDNPFSLKVISITGKDVLYNEHISFNDNLKKQFDLNIEKGVYLIVVEQAGISMVKRLVVN